MKGLVFCLFMAISAMAYSQELNWDNPVIESGNVRYELVSIDDWGNYEITYEKYFEGFLAERGSFINKKKDGVWYQYDREGNVISSMGYDNDIRQWLRTTIEGKEVYIIYQNGKATEVTYYLASN